MQEVKCKDTYWQTAGVTTTGTWQICNGISQGYTARTRIGNKITIRRIEYKAEVTWQDAHSATSTSRVIVFLDTQCNGTTPALGTMFLTTATSYTAYVQPFYWEYMDRFIPIYDKSVSMSSDYGGASVGNDPRALLKYEIDCNIPVTYTGSGGTEADISTNALWCFWIGNATTGGVNAPDVNNWCRVIFSDT